MILPFTMTFAGSVPVICCLIFYLADRQSFHAACAWNLVNENLSHTSKALHKAGLFL